MAIFIRLDRMDEKLAAVAAGLKSQLPTRTIKREFLFYSEHTDKELRDGVVMLISDGEGNYSNSPGMIAKNGTHKMIVIGHLKVPNSASKTDIESAEIMLIEEIKAFCRKGVQGVTLVLRSAQHSRQLEYPIGWVVCVIEALSPDSNIY